MESTIILNCPPDVPIAVKQKFIDSVNVRLSPICSEVNNWNGFIELRNTGARYELVAICDDDSVRQKMEALLVA